MISLSHSSSRAIWAACVLAVVAFGHLALPVSAVQQLAADPVMRPARLASLPVYFETNAGQTGREFDFVARTVGSQVLVGARETALTLTRVGPASAPMRPSRGASNRAGELQSVSVRMHFMGADPLALLSGEHPLTGRVHYLLGHDPTQWRPDVPLFAKVRVAGLYPGVDLVYYGNDRSLEYDFEVAPHVDPAVIAVRFEGADAVRVAANGDLVLQVGTDEIRHLRPVVFQLSAMGRQSVEGRYRLLDAQTVGFDIGHYDRSRPLTIDPVVSYSTFLGGSGVDTAWALATDASGAVYLAGQTTSAQLPVTAGAWQTNYAGGAGFGGDVFVAKFNPGGETLAYLTYLGGSSDEAALALAVDAAGNAHLTGFTDSPNFPLASALYTNISGTPDPFRKRYPVDAFVAKLNASGSALIYSTYLGGSAFDEGIGIAVDPTGDTYVVGYTESTNFPTANAFQSTNAGRGDAFVAKLSSNGTVLSFSTYLGGTNQDAGNDIAVNALGEVVVAGATSSTNFPVTNAIQPWLAGGWDAFVTVIESSGTNLVRSTYFGSRQNDAAYRLATDPADAIYLAGSTDSLDSFPRKPEGWLSVSTDAAGSWSDLGADVLGSLEDLAIDPTNPARIYAGTRRGVARSDDGGVTWETAITAAPTASGLAPAVAVDSVNAVLVDPGTPGTVYAGTWEGVFKSLDFGANWFLSSTGLVNQAVRTLALDPFTPATLYAGTDGGVFTSTNGASAWRSINSGLGSLSVRDLIADDTTPGILYAATAQGIYRSLNRGTNWSAFTSGLTNLSARALALIPGSPPTLFAGTDGGLFKSVNGGTNWTAAQNGLGVSNTVYAIAVDPTSPTTVYAGTYHGFFESNDGGNSWLRETNWFSATSSVTAITLDPSSPATVYVGAYQIVFEAESGPSYAFATKLSPEIEFSRVFGGEAKDEAWDLALDGQGNVLLVGMTASTNFPARLGSGFLRAINFGGFDAFVMVLDSQGETVCSGYWGGESHDYGYAIACDPAGNIYFAGQTVSTNFPTAAPFQAVIGGEQDAFLAKISIEPALKASLAGNSLVLAWPEYAPGYVLEGNPDLLNSAGWGTVPQSPVVSNHWNTVTLDPSHAAMFFRLRRP